MNNKVPPKPVKPTPHECCGSGCNPCVFDYYYTELEKWEEAYQEDVKNAEADESKGQK